MLLFVLCCMQVIFQNCYVRLNGNNSATVKLIPFRILKVMILFAQSSSKTFIYEVQIFFDNQTLINHKF